jgi:hypothetical protein
VGGSAPQKYWVAVRVYEADCQMKCLSKGCQNTSLLMTVELCYPCTQLVEHKSVSQLIAQYVARIAELEAELKKQG